MHCSSYKSQIKSLRHQSLLASLDFIGLTLFLIVLNIFLPNILIRYVYAGQPLFEEPKFLTYLPFATVVILLLVFLKTWFGNVTRSLKAQSLESECCGDCGHGMSADDQLSSLKKAIKSAPKKKSTRRSKKTK